PLGALYGPLHRSDVLAMLHRRLFANAADVEADQLAHDQADLVLADVRANRELARDLVSVDRASVLGAWDRPLRVLLASSDAFIDAGATARALRVLAPHAAIVSIPGGHGWTPAYVRAQQDALTQLIDAHDVSRE